MFVCFALFHCVLAQLRTFGPILVPFWLFRIPFWCPFGSMLVHFAPWCPLKPTLRPTTAEKQSVCICVLSFFTFSPHPTTTFTTISFFINTLIHLYISLSLSLCIYIYMYIYIYTDIFSIINIYIYVFTQIFVCWYGYYKWGRRVGRSPLIKYNIT